MKELILKNKAAIIIVVMLMIALGSGLAYFNHYFSGSGSVPDSNIKKEKRAEKKKVKPYLKLPEKSRESVVKAKGRNSDGAIYNYTFYMQNPGGYGLDVPFNDYEDYLAMHGCSTCAMTTILAATKDKYRDYTPDMVIEELMKPVLGESFEKNFAKTPKRQMPLGLKGIAKIFNHCGVKYKLVHEYTRESAIKEIRAHLKEGNPILFTAHKNSVNKGVYTGAIHTMIMLGLDKNGNVVIGDSVHGRAKKWGKKAGLVKHGTLTDPDSGAVEKLVEYFDQSTDTMDGVGDFYNGLRGYVGYILIYK